MSTTTSDLIATAAWRFPPLTASMRRSVERLSARRPPRWDYARPDASKGSHAARVLALAVEDLDVDTAESVLRRLEAEGGWIPEARVAGLEERLRGSVYIASMEDALQPHGYSVTSAVRGLLAVGALKADDAGGFVVFPDWWVARVR